MCLKFILHLKKKKNLKNLFLNRAILSVKGHRFAEKDETDALMPYIDVQRLRGGFLPGKEVHGRD